MAEVQLPRDATVDTIVPQSSKTTLESFREIRGDHQRQIPQRDILFFDEHLAVYVVLYLRGCSESTVKRFLSRVSVSLDAFAIDGLESHGNNEQDGQNEKSRELVYSGRVENPTDPLVITDGRASGQNSDSVICLVWKTAAFLNRPRVRLQQPFVIFAASVTFNPPGRGWGAAREEYLPTLMPASVNIFQPLCDELTGKNRDLYLPASRILRVVPASRPEDSVYNFEQLSFNPIRVIPIASSRIRYARTFQQHAEVSEKIATLNFEVTPFTSFEVILDNVELSLTDGDVSVLTESTGCSPPVKCCSRDDITIIYKLTPNYAGFNPKDPVFVSILQISLRARVLISDECQPIILMEWRSNVEFLAPSKSIFKYPNGHLVPDAGTGLSARPNLLARDIGSPVLNRTSYLSKDHTVILSFSGPQTVQVGKAFYWEVFISNRSEKLRRFGLSAVPLLKNTSLKKHITKASSSSLASGVDEDVAAAVADDNIIYGKHKDATASETELLCLSTDITVGPLLPGTCYSTRLSLLPLSSGRLALDSIKLTDMFTNEFMEIKELPDIIAFSLPVAEN